jgi:hypothetical protein
LPVKTKTTTKLALGYHHRGAALRVPRLSTGHNMVMPEDLKRPIISYVLDKLKPQLLGNHSKV